MMVVGVKDGDAVPYPYSCGWVLYILFYLHVLYRLPTPGDILEEKSHMSWLPQHLYYAVHW